MLRVAYNGGLCVHLTHEHKHIVKRESQGIKNMIFWWEELEGERQKEILLSNETFKTGLFLSVKESWPLPDKPIFRPNICFALGIYLKKISCT